MSETAHTPGPWMRTIEVDTCYIHEDGGDLEGYGIARTCGQGLECNEANAAFIVRACNCHEELVEACRQAEAVNQGSYRDAHARGCGCDRCGLTSVLRAAIAKATKAAGE